MTQTVSPLTLNQDTQVPTVTPQSAPVQPGPANNASGKVQPSIANTSLTSHDGLLLSQAPPIAGNLAGSPAVTTATGTVAPPTPQHHLHPLAIGIPVILAVAVVTTVWFMKRPGHRTEA